jgi:hypothetical protein
VWLLMRPRLRRRTAAVEPGGAGAATALALSAAVLVVWVLNPFAALVLVPAVHLWMLAMLAGVRLRGRTAGLVVALALAPLALAAVVYMDRLSLDPLEGLWYLWILVTGHAVSPVTTVLACLVAGIAVTALSLIAARVGTPPPPEPDRPSLRGPGGHAGPGSLGGTPSTLSRR